MSKNRLEEIGKVIQTHWAFSILGFIATLFTIGGGVLWACGQLRDSWAWLAVLIGPPSLLMVLLVAIWKLSRPPAVVQASVPTRPLQKMKCRPCEGTGHNPIVAGPAEPCYACKGKGYLFTDRIGQPNCVFCSGHGYRSGATNTACPVCGGIGLMPWD